MTAPSPAAVNKGKVTVTNFSLSYDTLEGPVEAVSDTSIRVDPGEFVSIIGPSGCGKSTLLNAVAGFLKPTHGEVDVDWAAVAGRSADRGMVFQQYSLFPWKTVRENVEFGLKMKGIDRSTRETSARTLLGLTGLLSFENQYPDTRSGGMKQRVGIIRALATGRNALERPRHQSMMLSCEFLALRRGLEAEYDRSAPALSGGVPVRHVGADALLDRQGRAAVLARPLHRQCRQRAAAQLASAVGEQPL